MRVIDSKNPTRPVDRLSESMSSDIPPEKVISRRWSDVTRMKTSPKTPERHRTSFEGVAHKALVLGRTSKVEWPCLRSRPVSDIWAGERAKNFHHTISHGDADNIVSGNHHPCSRPVDNSFRVGSRGGLSTWGRHVPCQPQAMVNKPFRLGPRHPEFEKQVRWSVDRLSKSMSSDIPPEKVIRRRWSEFTPRNVSDRCHFSGRTSLGNLSPQEEADPMQRVALGNQPTN